jgi:hypothetical protein
VVVAVMVGVTELVAVLENQVATVEALVKLITTLFAQHRLKELLQTQQVTEIAEV